MQPHVTNLGRTAQADLQRGALVSGVFMAREMCGCEEAVMLHEAAECWSAAGTWAHTTLLITRSSGINIALFSPSPSPGVCYRRLSITRSPP